MNEHTQATSAVTLVSNLNIFDREQFALELERLQGRPVAQADTIASHAKRAITERMEEDPAFYRKLSQLIDETIQLHKQGRIDEVEYLKRMHEVEATLASGMTDATPRKLAGYRHARAYFGVMSDTLDGHSPDPETLADLAIQFEQSIEDHKVRDWVGNRDIENRMKLALDDVLYEAKRDNSWILSNAEMGAVLDGVMEVARRRDTLP